MITLDYSKFPKQCLKWLAAMEALTGADRNSIIAALILSYAAKSKANSQNSNPNPGHETQPTGTK